MDIMSANNYEWRVMNRKIKDSVIWEKIRSGKCLGCENEGNIGKMYMGYLVYFCSEECVDKVKGK